MISKSLTYEQKLKLYWANKWSAPCPWVATGRWEEKDWIAWIDCEGQWGKVEDDD